MTKSTYKSFLTPLITLNVLFIVYYTILAIYSRPHYDDLHFLWKMREMSIYDYVMDMYNSRSGRFVGYAINGIVFKAINTMGFHWVFPILFWLIGVLLSIYSVVKLSNNKFNLILVNIVVLIYNIFVLTNIDFAVFNWLCAMSYYILAPAMLALLALILSIKNNVIEYFALIVLSVFLGGGQEAFTPIVIAVLFFIAIFQFYKYQFNFAKTIKSPLVTKIIASGLLMFILLIIVVVAPGNYNRLSMDEFSTPTNITEYFKGFVNAISMFSYYIAFYIPYYILLAFIIFKFTNRNFNLKSIIRKEFFITSLIIYGMYILLSVFPSVYLWGGFGIQRNYTHLVFVTLLFIVYWFQFLIFKLYNFNHKIIDLVAFIGLIILNAVMIFNLYNDTNSAKKYASDVDKRIELANKHKKSNTKSDLIVKPLTIPFTIDVKYALFEVLNKKNNPRPVLYYISDTEKIPNEYAGHFKKYYQLNFDIVTKK